MRYLSKKQPIKDSRRIIQKSTLGGCVSLEENPIIFFSHDLNSFTISVKYFEGNPDVRFWLDDWAGEGPLCELFHRIFRAVTNKEAAVSDCYEVEDDSIVWVVSFRRNLRSSEEVQYRELLSFLSNIFLCRNSKYYRIWKHYTSGAFSAKAFVFRLRGTPAF